MAGDPQGAAAKRLGPRGSRSSELRGRRVAAGQHLEHLGEGLDGLGFVQRLPDHVGLPLDALVPSLRERPTERHLRHGARGIAVLEPLPHLLQGRGEHFIGGLHHGVYHADLQELGGLGHGPGLQEELRLALPGDAGEDLRPEVRHGDAQDHLVQAHAAVGGNGAVVAAERQDAAARGASALDGGSGDLRSGIDLDERLAERGPELVDPVVVRHRHVELPDVEARSEDALLQARVKHHCAHFGIRVQALHGRQQLLPKGEAHRVHGLPGEGDDRDAILFRDRDSRARHGGGARKTGNLRPATWN
mmetsp:Transcript_120941/g.347448  ORF Transcript_120941/g.347448 Transcript_120941/m.347448 type:complete len:304 (+) Transcript_120941:108-1019(+)